MVFGGIPPLYQTPKWLLIIHNCTRLPTCRSITNWVQKCGILSHFWWNVWVNKVLNHEFWGLWLGYSMVFSLVFATSTHKLNPNGPNARDLTYQKALPLRVWPLHGAMVESSSVSPFTHIHPPKPQAEQMNHPPQLKKIWQPKDPSTRKEPQTSRSPSPFPGSSQVVVRYSLALAGQQLQSTGHPRISVAVAWSHLGNF